MATVARGSILWTTVLDPQGGNPKSRPVVIVTASENIKVGQPVQAVAVSTTLDDVPAAERVDLPWQSTKHPKTGLREASAAICKWVVTFTLTADQTPEGFVPGKQLLEILRKIGSLPT